MLKYDLASLSLTRSIALLHCICFQVRRRKVRKEYRYSISNYILISYIKNHLLFTHFPPPSYSAKMQCNAILQYGMMDNPKQSRKFADMNNFDYTSVPGDLLYSDRRYLDDFDVDNSKSLNYLIEKEFDRMFGTCPDYETFAKNAFNTVYYVCTLALADGHPQRRFGAYLSIVDSRKYGMNDEVGVILSIILIQINIHNWRETKPEMDNLALKFHSEIEKNYATIYYGFYQQVMNKYQARAPYTTLPPDSEFKPREITMGVLKRTCSHWDWKNHFGTDMEMMLEFIFAIGKNEDEQMLISSFLQEQTHSSFTDGAEHNYCFDHIKRLIYLKYHADEEKNKIDAEIEEDLMREYEQQRELDYYKDEFSKLKSENENLHAEIKQLKEYIKGAITIDVDNEVVNLGEFGSIVVNNPKTHGDATDKVERNKSADSQQENKLENLIGDVQQSVEGTPRYIESLNRQLSEEKEKNAQLEREIKQLREVLELDKILESDSKRLQIDERIIIVSTVLGTPWNSDLTNQTQLAKIIEYFSGDDWRSIRSRIVAINSEMKRENKTPGEGLSQGTKEAISNVIGWLGKATRGEQNTPTTDKLIKEIKDVFLNIME